MISPAPNKQPMLNPKGFPESPWMAFFSETFSALAALQSSGTTAQRPTEYLFVGRNYFDKTLNKPIWIGNDGSTWVDATGTPV